MNDSTLPPPATAITSHLVLLPNTKEAFANWQSKFTSLTTQAQGFLALDIAPTFPGSAEWRIIQRFRSPEDLEAWRFSMVRRHIFAELAPMRSARDAGPDDEVMQSIDPMSCVTEVIQTLVETGKEQVFQSWAETIQARQSTFPGYMGTLVQAPVSAEMPCWTTLVRFSTPEQLDTWLSSSERRQLLERVQPDVATWKSYRMSGPFAGWFPSSGNKAPPAWKQSMLVLLVLFPVVALEIKFLSPLLAGLSTPVATFIGNAISVALTSWPLMGLAVRCMGWWLRPEPSKRTEREGLGLCTMAVLYIIELAIFTLVFKA